MKTVNYSLPSNFVDFALVAVIWLAESQALRGGLEPVFGKVQDTLGVEKISGKCQAVSKCPVLTKMVQPSTLKGLCALMCGLRNQVPLG